MTHTTEQLQGMSDFEVNKALADSLKVKWQISAVDDECLMVGAEVLDYCSNPNDIMPLAFERGISINVESNFDYPIGDGEWVASECVCPAHGMTINVGGKSFTNDNPLRAIACLFLLIGGE